LGTLFEQEANAHVFYTDEARIVADHALTSILSYGDSGLNLPCFEIAGPRSNVEFLERLVRHRSIVDGEIDALQRQRRMEGTHALAQGPRRRHTDDNHVDLGNPESTDNVSFSLLGSGLFGYC